MPDEIQEEYQLLEGGMVERLSDNAFIPNDTGNSDYQAFLTWQSEGGKARPAPPSEFHVFNESTGRWKLDKAKQDAAKQAEADAAFAAHAPVALKALIDKLTADGVIDASDIPDPPPPEVVVTE